MVLHAHAQTALLFVCATPIAAAPASRRLCCFQNTEQRLVHVMIRDHDPPFTCCCLLACLQDKLAYLVSVVESCWADGRPVLIGTSSVNESESVLQVLQEWCRPSFRELSLRVQLLNAKPENVRLEAQVGQHACAGLSLF
eukprot:GHRQ01039331.1.p2 GENE.GHRQ01039331.1~~GHRQ01039331.1.p2  ORF type:complete len:140 (-),score=37.93 GHRQ01039331.1:783-1202(-)